MEVGPFKVGKITLITGLVPVRDVFGVEFDALVGHSLDYCGVGGAIEQQMVDSLALGLWEGGYFTIEAALDGHGERECKFRIGSGCVHFGLVIFDLSGVVSGERADFLV